MSEILGFIWYFTSSSKMPKARFGYSRLNIPVTNISDMTTEFQDATFQSVGLLCD